MDFIVKGGKQLSGTITNNTSKNGAMGLLCASLLNYGTTTLHGIPKIEEVSRICEVLESIGVKLEWIGHNSLKIQRPKVLKLENINAASASKTRTILMFMGPLIHDFSDFRLPNSQGCKLGKRSITTHKYALEELGVKIKVEENAYHLTHKGLKPAKVIMYEASDTGTENILMAAAKITKPVEIKFASANYMVQDVCLFLQKLGVQIEGIGTTTLKVTGVSEINTEVEFWNSEDPIEAMMWITSAIVTKSQLLIKRCSIDFLEPELYRLKKMGVKFNIGKTYLANNGHTKLVDLEIKKTEKLKALEDKIYPGAYPDLNSDNLPFFVPIASLAAGRSLIHDWMYENRAIYFTELNRLGANIVLADPHRVFVDGIQAFTPGQVVSPPALRPAVIVLLAMLNADGESILRNVYSIRRGYEEIAERLNSIGADITVI